MTNYLGLSSLVIAAILLSTLGIFVRFLNEFMTTLHQIGYRGFVALIPLVLIMVYFHIYKGGTYMPREKVFKIILVGIVHPASVFMLTLAYLKTSILITLFALYLGSLLSAIVLSVWYFKEPFTSIKLLASSMLVVALFCIVDIRSEAFVLDIGFVYGFIAGILMTFANTLTKMLKAISRVVEISAAQMAGAVVGAILGILIGGGDIILDVSTYAWTLVVLYGVVVLFASYCITYGFQHYDLNLGTIVLATQLFWGPLFGFFVFQEGIALNEFIGGTLIILAVIVSNMPKHYLAKIKNRD